MRFHKFIFILMISLLVSCSDSNKEETLPAFPNSAGINQEFSITLGDEIQPLEYGQPFEVFVINNSEHQIQFSKGYGLVLYALHENNWETVQNGMTVYSFSDIVLRSKNDVAKYGSLGVKPVIPFDGEQYKIVVYLSGTMADENGKPIKEVSAYKEFTLVNKK
jgi:hypothetical protein